MIQKNTVSTDSIRIDKWLWCARFYKTRGDACSAIKSGKIYINNEKAKPSKLVQTGDLVKIRKGPYSFYLTIKNLAKVRKSAGEATLLYEESQESIQQREIISQNIKAEAAKYPRSRGRPSKRERRDLIKFKGQNL